MADCTDREYWFYLSSLYKISIRRRAALLSCLKSPAGIFHEKKLTRENFPFLTEEDEATFAAERSTAWLQDEYGKMTEAGIRFISCRDAEYPERLTHIDEAPFGLFCIGDPMLLTRNSVAVVGARACSAYGKHVAFELGRSLSEAGVTVVSGMAYGIDGEAHRGTMVHTEGPVRSIAVLAGGVDICYPREHYDLYEELCRRGLVLSENPPKTAPLRYLFPRRNRLISGLCTSMVVVEAREKSGSLITVSYALEQGRNVYAVPGRIDEELSRGTNALILEGATPLLEPGQILKEMDLSPALSGHSQEKIEKSLEKAEVLLYSLLDYEPSHIDDLVAESGMDLSSVSLTLLQLELKGYISQPVRNYYTKLL